MPTRVRARRPSTGILDPRRPGRTDPVGVAPVLVDGLLRHGRADLFRVAGMAGGSPRAVSAYSTCVCDSATVRWPGIRATAKL
jgi:hypothetical protein